MPYPFPFPLLFDFFDFFFLWAGGRFELKAGLTSPAKGLSSICRIRRAERAESREQRAESREQRAESREQRVDFQVSKKKWCYPKPFINVRCGQKGEEQRAVSREKRAEIVKHVLGL
jgi:hypothetical protein